MYLAVLAVCSMFNELCTYDGFNTFSHAGGLGATLQDFFFKYIFEEAIASHMAPYADHLRKTHPGITLRNLRPYVSESVVPNVLSPYHLISQSLCHEHVFVLHYLLNNV